MDLDGWRPDPFGTHEERLFAQGEPTPLVRDDGVGSVDAHSVAESSEDLNTGETGRGAGEGEGVWVVSPPRAATAGDGAHARDPRTAHAPAKPWLAAAASLIAAGVVVGFLGIAGVGSGGGAPTTTLNPLARVFLNLLRGTTTTESPIQRALRALPPTTTESPIERALQALPRSTTTAPDTSIATTPVSTRAPSIAAARSPATHVTQPSLHPTPTAPRPIIAATTLPLTTITTSVGEADQTWYLANGTVFNTLQTDIEKIDRALASISESSYSTVDPYWQELFTDAGLALRLPPIPDPSTQSEWASALGDLSEGATECIIGSLGTTGGAGAPVSIPPIFSQGSAFITTGTTQMDDAAGSVQIAAAATSAAARSQVSGWYQSHAATFSMLQTDITKLDAAFGSAGASNATAVDPYWQQLMRDAQSAAALRAIPDGLIQDLWFTALQDLITGSSDCLGATEALPPNPFDQGVALIDSGTTYLSTALGAVQTLIR